MQGGVCGRQLVPRGESWDASSYDGAGCADKGRAGIVEFGGIAVPAVLAELQDGQRRGGVFADVDGLDEVLSRGSHHD